MKRERLAIPPAELLREYFTYDLATGKLLNRKARHKSVVGAEPGDVARVRPGKPLYRRLNFQGKRYFVHRIIWCMHTGAMAADIEIDHEDGDGLNNRLDNLRAVPHTINQKNNKRARNNTSGHNGVYWHKAAQKWCVEARAASTKHYLGLYTSLDAAVRVRKAFDPLHGFHANHGRCVA